MQQQRWCVCVRLLLAHSPGCWCGCIAAALAAKMGAPGGPFTDRDVLNFLSQTECLEVRGGLARAVRGTPCCALHRGACCHCCRCYC